MTDAVASGAAAAEVVGARVPGFVPALGIVLGSGLGGLADTLEDAVSIPYGELPGFPVPSVKGHGGRLVLGRLGGTPVACYAGRKHVYEGGDPGAMRAPVRALRQLGASALLVTNAAGSLRAEVGPGRLMAIADHVNMLGVNPLTGPNDEAVGPRFPPMGAAYDPELRGRLHEIAARLGVALADGVYLATPGPCFETPAEIRAFRTLGADAVGMSTVPEVIIARHCGLRVAGISAITNLAEGMGAEELSHEHTLANADVAARDLTRLVTAFCEEWE